MEFTGNFTKFAVVLGCLHPKILFLSICLKVCNGLNLFILFYKFKKQISVFLFDQPQVFSLMKTLFK